MGHVSTNLLQPLLGKEGSVFEGVAVEVSASELAKVVTTAAAEELNGAADKIRHCAKQLSDEQMWWRPAESMNSIANLILHLCGNVQQWIVAGVGGVEDTRNRPLEFSQREMISKDELIQRLESTTARAIATMQAAPIDELLRSRSIQGFEATGIGALFHSVSHFQGHTQEIVHLTRMQRGDSYEFALVLPSE